MNAPYPPGYPPAPGYLPPPPRKGMGCFATGCLITVIVLVALGLLVGGMGWYAYYNLRPFVSITPVVIRTYPATPEQYAGVLDKVHAFQTHPAGTRAVPLELSADDLNILVARSPGYEKARGKVYFSIIDNRLVLEMCFPLTRFSRGGKPFYFSGKLSCDASYSDGDFAFVVRRLEAIDGGPAPRFLQTIITNPDFNRNVSRSFNDGFHGALRKNPGSQALMARIRTIVIQNDHVVITAAEGN